jgi:SulP family sulfate permease
MAIEASARASRRFPVLEGVRPIDRKRVPTEVIAGITLACLAIPEVMGYANIAGMPVITGLYTLVLPVVIFALLGSSRHLVVGADSASAAIMFAGLTGMAAVASPQWVALAGMLALITAGFLLLARVLRLGFIANFLSRTVLIGFLTGVGIQVACGQFSGLFGLTKTGGGSLAYVFNAFKDMGSASLTTPGGVGVGHRHHRPGGPSRATGTVGAHRRHRFDRGQRGLGPLRSRRVDAGHRAEGPAEPWLAEHPGQ